MRKFDINQKYENPIVLSLGFFDCIHIGHKKLLETANEIAKKIGAESFIMTFSNDPSSVFGKSKQIYTFADRLLVLENLHLDGVISATFDRTFSGLSPDDFLNLLISNFNIKTIVVGADYTFGINAVGDVKFLKDFCDRFGIDVFVVPFECVGGEKLSTRNLKSLVNSGDVETLNAYISEPYFMIGKVAHAKRNGTRMGFPTANITQNDNRLALKNGVYATKISFDGREYLSMTNVGAKPTFNDFSESVETYIMNFDGDLYGKEVKLTFFKRLRDIQTFCNQEQLRQQLENDEQSVKTLFNL